MDVTATMGRLAEALDANKAALDKLTAKIEEFIAQFELESEEN